MNNQIHDKQQMVNNQRAEHTRRSDEVDRETTAKANIDNKAEELHKQRMDKGFAVSGLARKAANRQVEIADIRERYIKSKTQAESSPRRRYDSQLNSNQQRNFQ